MGFSFGKEYRLLSRNDFLNLKKNSQMIEDSLMMVFYKKSFEESRSLTRIGLAVSKKTGNAVVRNKIKRILREEFRTSQFRDLGVDVLLVVRRPFQKREGKKPLKNISSKDFQAFLFSLKRSFHRCLQRI